MHIRRATGNVVSVSYILLFSIIHCQPACVTRANIELTVMDNTFHITLLVLNPQKKSNYKFDTYTKSQEKARNDMPDLLKGGYKYITKVRNYQI